MQHLSTSADAEKLVGLRVFWMLGFSLVALCAGVFQGGAISLAIAITCAVSRFVDSSFDRTASA